MSMSSPGRWSRCRVALGALAGAVLLVASLSAQPPEQPPMPEGLRHVPPDAMAFAHVRVGEFLQSEAGKALLEKLGADKMGALMFKRMEAATGIPLKDVDSMTVIMLEPPWQGMPMRPDHFFLDKKPAFGMPKIKIEMPKIDIKIPPIIFPKDPPKIELPPPLPKLENKKFEEQKLDEQGRLHDVDGESFVALQRERFPERFPEELHDFLGEDSYEPVVVVTAKAPLDRRALVKRLLAPPRGDDDEPFHGHRPGRDPSLLILSDRSILVGPPAALMRYVNHQAKEDAAGAKGKSKPGPLAPILALAADKHLVVAGVQPSSWARTLMLLGQHGPIDGLAPITLLYPLTTLSAAGLTADLGANVELSLHLRAANERSAALAAEAAKNMLVMADLGLERLVNPKAVGLIKAKKPSAAQIQFVQRARKAAADAAVKQNGAAVNVQARMEIDAATITAAVSEIFGNLQQSGQRTMSVNNLKQIGLAMHNHASAFRFLPPAALTGIKNKDGKPLLSWRVAILPFIEQDALYKQFNLDEPWDSEHNKKLIAQMPPIYAAPGIETKERGLTFYQAFVGPRTLFEPIRKDGTQVKLRIEQIPDGTSNTLMVVEAAAPVIWSKPDDLPFDEQKPLPKLGGLYGDGFNALFGDGSVRFISSRIAENTLRLLIMRDDGQPIPEDFFRD